MLCHEDLDHGKEERRPNEEAGTEDSFENERANLAKISSSLFQNGIDLGEVTAKSRLGLVGTNVVTSNDGHALLLSKRELGDDAP